MGIIRIQPHFLVLLVYIAKHIVKETYISCNSIISLVGGILHCNPQLWVRVIDFLTHGLVTLDTLSLLSVFYHLLVLNCPSKPG